MKEQKIIIAGFGGQGILSAGTLLAHAGMLEGRHVSWLPSYGPEMRGGTANCHVILSDYPVGSPIIRRCSALVVMNTPSLEKFEDSVASGGLILADSTMTGKGTVRRDVMYVGIPAAQLAEKAGKIIYACIILIGKLLALAGTVRPENFEQALYHVLPEKYHAMIPDEMAALRQGMAY
jgi:2-oxoglutarate ferredoxin oxidoreductase subunit gamma